MIDVSILKGIAAASSVVGSVLLAIRVKGLLDALAFAAKMHDFNMKQLAGSEQNIVLAVDATKHVTKAQRHYLFMLGFGFLILSGLLNLWAAFYGP